MIIPGLVSVTLRQYDVDQLVGVVAETGLHALHWGGDVHVPVGDHAAARRARSRCEHEKIEIEGYGSYYRAGHSAPETFRDVLDTARTLGAPRIRVWAGASGAEETTSAQRVTVIDDLTRCTEMAWNAGVRVVLEYHPWTLTDDIGSTLRVLEQVDHEGLESSWQPGAVPRVHDSLHEVSHLLPRLAGAHVFAWGEGGYSDRLPLAERDDLWRAVLTEMDADELNRHALLEFVRDDSPQELRRDAKTLRSWLDDARSSQSSRSGAWPAPTPRPRRFPASASP